LIGHSPQSTIPNPQSPIPISKILFFVKIKNKFNSIKFN